MPSLTFPVATTKPDVPSGREQGNAVIPAGNVGDVGLFGATVAIADPVAAAGSAVPSSRSPSRAPSLAPGVFIVVPCADDDDDEEEEEEEDDDGESRDGEEEPGEDKVPAPNPYISPFGTNLKLFLGYALA